MKLAYVATWQEDTRYTWSGSAYGLMKALEKRFCLTNYDVQMEYPSGTYIESNSTLGRTILTKKMKKILKNTQDEIIFQLEDFANIDNKINCIYQDLSVDAIIDISIKNPEAFKVSGFQDVDLKFLNNRNRIQKEFYQKTDYIFVMGKYLKEHMINVTGIPREKIVICGAGVNIDTSQVNLKNKKKNKILFIGKDFRRKGGYLLLDAFIELRKRMPEAELYIIGPGEKPFDGEIEGVYYLGFKSYEELPYYYNYCDVFCMPSKFEAYGIVFAEALIYGLPCIARNDFAMNEIIADGISGYLIDRDDVNFLAEKMHEALHNEKMSRFVRDQYSEYVIEYSWDTVADRIYKVLSANRKNG